MFIKKGRYNIARVMLPDESFLDEQTHQQIQDFLNHPALQGKPVAIMPDVHFGKGSCVGFTFPLNDYVIPEMVGVDIGCGIYSYKLPLKYSPGMDLDVLDDFIREHIPAGFSIHTNRGEDVYEEIDDMFGGEMFDNPLEHISAVTGWIGGNETMLQRYYDSLGTLGGGNHFIEMGKDEEDNLWLTVHSGSRKFGLDICNFYQNQAKELGEKFFANGVNFLPMGLGGDNYLRDMEQAQYYAHLNRLLMLREIVVGYFGLKWNELDIVETVHNYINFEDNIIRKGAVQANAGQMVVIPFNMEDGLIIGEGKGNPDWNFSAPHGAGRLLSRNQAKKTLSLEEAKAGMQNAGVFTTSMSEDTLDEAKLAYKPKELILEMIKDTVNVLHFVKPIYNFKSGKKTE